MCPGIYASDVKKDNVFRTKNLARYWLKHADIYSKTCVKRPLKTRQNKGLNDKW